MLQKPFLAPMLTRLGATRMAQRGGADLWGPKARGPLWGQFYGGDRSATDGVLGNLIRPPSHTTKEGVDRLVAEYPLATLDILVNNTGTNIRRLAEEYTEEEVQSIMSTNFVSVFRCCKACWRGYDCIASALVDDSHVCILFASISVCE